MSIVVGYQVPDGQQQPNWDHVYSWCTADTLRSSGSFTPSGGSATGLWATLANTSNDDYKQAIIRYTNDKSANVKIKKIHLMMGVGALNSRMSSSIPTWGVPITLRMIAGKGKWPTYSNGYYNEDSTHSDVGLIRHTNYWYSDYNYIQKQVRGRYPSGWLYDSETGLYYYSYIRQDGQLYTFTFEDEITVAPGDSIWFMFDGTYGKFKSGVPADESIWPPDLTQYYNARYARQETDNGDGTYSYSNYGSAFSEAASAVICFGMNNLEEEVIPDVSTTVTLTYNANGGSGAPAAAQLNPGVAGTVSSTKPTKSSTSSTITTTFDNQGSTSTANSTKTTSYTFSTWNTKQNGSGTSYSSGGSITISADTTLWAQYTSSVSYSAVTFPADPTRTGYVFKGWYTDPTGGTQKSSGYKPEANGTLYARWAATVTYNANGGSGAPSVQTAAIPPTTTVLSNTKPTKPSSSGTPITVTFNSDGGQVSPSSETVTPTTSYPFVNWNTQSNGSGTTYQAGTAYSVGTPLVLYAQYSTVTSTPSVTLPTPTRTGATFSGWYDGDTKVGVGGSSYTPTANVTLKAKWGCTVSFDNNSDGGTTSGGPGDQSATPDEPFIIPDSYPSKSIVVTYNVNVSTGTDPAVVSPTTSTLSLEFLGWSTTKITNRSGSQSDVEYSPGDSFTPSGSMSLYAVWKANTLSSLPTYRSSGTPRIYRGSNSEEYRLDTSTPWTTTANGSTAVTSSYQFFKNTTIYAKWEYRITFDANGGLFMELIDEEDVGPGENVTDAPVITSDEDDPDVGPDDEDSDSIMIIWKKHGQTLVKDFSSYNDGPAIIRSGYQPSGFSTSSTATSASLPLNISYSTDSFATFYVIWSIETYSVTFKYGYTKTGSDTIRVVASVPYGGAVPDNQVPKFNVDFTRPGSYTFVGWSGSYRNIRSDTTLIAQWDFAPVWVCVLNSYNQKVWIPYKPVEREE